MRRVGRTVSPWERGWRPGAGVGDHSGGSLRADVDFFAPPPEELGPVVSADSSARVGEVVCPWWLRFAVIAGVTALLAVVADTATLAHSVANADRYEDQIILRAIVDTIVILGGLAALALLKWPRTARQCSYVCRDGFATFTLRSGRRVTAGAMVPFTSVNALFDSQHDLHYHGLYGGTRFRYTWRDAAGRVLLKWSGGHTEKNRAPRRHSLHGLAVAAESAWTEHRLRRAAEELQAGRKVEFPVNGGRSGTLRVARGLLEIVRPDGSVEGIEPAQVKKLGVQDRRFILRTRDARTFSTAGKFDAPYRKLPNAKVLLTLLDAVFLAPPSDGPVIRPAA